jgi:5-(aminomethyl)-3-furanmethanol phosphate kinase
MWVFKLGGSLSDTNSLKIWLRMLAERGAGKAVIVPGGGAFADTVRAQQSQLRFDDRSAHRMALLAMAQYGYALCALEPRLSAARNVDAVRGALARQQIPVWLPFDLLETRADVEESWRMSSDSLAAWLAQQIDARHLVLVKNIAIERGAQMAALAVAGVVDQLFVEHARRGEFAVEVVGASAIERIRSAL